MNHLNLPNPQRIADAPLAAENTPESLGLALSLALMIRLLPPTKAVQFQSKRLFLSPQEHIQR